jgi:D-amino-acid dehydrogenase
VKTVVVIGGGIVGMATALWLQRDAHRVTVIDPRPPGHGTSFGNAAVIANYQCMPLGNPAVIRQLPRMLLSAERALTIRWRYLPKLAPWLVRFVWASRPRRVAAISDALAALQRHAVPDYRTLLEMADADHLVLRNGLLYLFGSPESYAHGRPEIELRLRHGMQLEEVSAKEIADLEPNLAPIYHRGILFPGATHLRSPLALVERFAQAFVQRGGTLIRDEARAIERNDNDGIVVRSSGAPLAADCVVVAAGAWSRPFARQVGDRIPLDTERGHHVMFAGAQSLLNRPVGAAELGFYMTPLADGLRAAGTVEFGGLDAPLDPRRIRFLVRGARTLLPQLSEPSSEWLGFRPSMPDSLPVIGPSPRNPKVFYAFGHGHLGVTFAAVTARMVADQIDGRRPGIDPSPYRPDRF